MCIGANPGTCSSNLNPNSNQEHTGTDSAYLLRLFDDYANLQADYLSISGGNVQDVGGYVDRIYTYLKNSNEGQIEYLERLNLDLVAAIEAQLNASPDRVLESKPGASLEDQDWFKAKKHENKKYISYFERLRSRSKSPASKRVYSDLIMKVSGCSDVSLFRSISQFENYKKGTRFCKCRVCSMCQSVLAAKRKNAVLAYVSEHEKEFRNLHFYHGIFNVKHDAQTRNYNYSKELLSCLREIMNKSGRVLVSNEFANWLKSTGFDGQARRLPKKIKQAHGNVKHRYLQPRKIWRHVAAGGMYSLEVTPGEQVDPSLHIHSHMLLISKYDFGNTRYETTVHPFVKWVRGYWNKYHEMPQKQQSVTFEKGYNLRVKGDQSTKEYLNPESDISDLSSMLSEMVKYTFKVDIKANEEKVNTMNADALASMLDPQNRARLFNVFGMLRGKGITNFSLDNLDEVELSNKAIIDSKGNEYTTSEAPLRLSPFYNNQPSKEIKNAYVFVSKDKTLRVDEGEAAKVLAMNPEFLFNQKLIQKAERNIKGGDDVDRNLDFINRINARQAKIKLPGGSPLSKWQDSIYDGNNEALQNISSLVNRDFNQAQSLSDFPAEKMESLHIISDGLRAISKPGLPKHISDELIEKIAFRASEMGYESESQVLFNTLELNEQQGKEKSNELPPIPSLPIAYKSGLPPTNETFAANLSETQKQIVIDSLERKMKRKLRSKFGRGINNL